MTLAPLILGRRSPSLPPWRQLSQHEKRRVSFHNVREAHIYGVARVGILGAVQELPAMVIFIVRHEQDWLSAFHDLDLPGFYGLFRGS